MCRFKVFEGNVKSTAINQHDFALVTDLLWYSAHTCTHTHTLVDYILKSVLHLGVFTCVIFSYSSKI